MPSWLPLLLGFLTAIGPLSIDMYLPAFPTIEAEFGAPHGSAELTLAAWFLGLAVGQIVQGSWPTGSAGAGRCWRGWWSTSSAPSAAPWR
ncbi:hypothetical protein [Teichococcus aestuarii]|uniref:hypothetical protein n=1 Tax=Teichococcus aestuarii TaxID=568898 RepID=UPI00361340B8